MTQTTDRNNEIQATSQKHFWKTYGPHALIDRALLWFGVPSVQRRIVYVVLASWMLGLLMPYLVARHASAMDGEQVATNLLSPLVKVRYEKQQECDALLMRLETQIASAGREPLQVTEDFVRELTARDKLQSMCSTLRGRIWVTGYADSNVKWLWTGLLAFLGLLAWVVPSSFSERASSESAQPRRIDEPAGTGCPKWMTGVMLCVFIWVAYRFSPLWRTYEQRVLDSGTIDETRKLYSWSNLDVSVDGFIAQEVLAFLVAILLTLIWRRWHLENLAVTRWSPASRDAHCDESVRELSALVSRAFHCLLIASTALCCAFVPYAHFFWRMVKEMGDQRYFTQAVVVHLLWLATWLMVALPFGRLWLRWEETRLQILSDDTLKSLGELEPVSRTHAALSAAIALLTALYPLVG